MSALAYVRFAARSGHPADGLGCPFSAHKADDPVDRDVDIIFCRNVLIYFDRPTQQKVVGQLSTHLRPGGYFIVGHSESMIHNEAKMLQQVLPTIFTV